MRSTRAIGSSTGSRLELNERWCTGTNSRAPAASAMAVCEVIPPSTERVDRSRKMPIYAREGVAHLWLLDPIVRTLEVLRLEAGCWVLIATHTDADVVRAEPFEAIAIDLASLWPAPPTVVE